MNDSSSSQGEGMTVAALETTKHVSNISSQNIRLKKKLDDLNQKYSNLQKNRDSEMLRLENSIQSMHKKHNEQLNVLNSTILTLQDTLGKLRTENTELRNTLTSSQSNFSSVLSPKDRIIKEEDFALARRTIDMENKRLSKELENQIAINNILQEKIENIPDYDNKLKKAQSEVKKLKKQKEIEKITDTQKLNIKQYIKQINDYKTKCSDQETEIAELKMTISELRYELSESQSNLSQKESEISQILCDASQNSGKAEDEEKNFSKTLEIFDNLSDEQNKQISELIKQRNTLLNLLKQFEESEIVCEDFLNRATNDNNKLEEQIEKVHLKLDKITEESETKVNSFVEELCNYYETPFNPSTPPFEQTIELIENNINKALSMKNEEEESADAQNKNNKYNRERELLVLGQLENSLRFIRSLAGSSSSNDTPFFDFQDRTLILTRCARIGQFIEEEAGDIDIPAVSNLFDPLSVETNSRLFFEFCNEEEDLNESPIRELYVMFLACLEVNYLLFNKNNELNHRKPNYSSKVDDSFKELYDEQTMKIREAEQMIRPYLSDNSQHDNFFSMIQEFIETYEELNKSKEDDAEFIDNLQAELKELSTMKNSLTNVSESEQKSLYMQMKRLKTENLRLKKSLEKVTESRKITAENSRKKQIEGAQTYLNKGDVDQNAFEEIHSKYKKLKKTANELKDQLNESKNTIKELSSEKELLLKEKEDIFCSSESRISELSENEQKTREKNSNLSKRVVELEKTNNETLLNLRKRADDMNGKYEERITKLDQELKDTRSNLVKCLAEIKELRKEKMNNQMIISKYKIEEKNRDYLVGQLTAQIKIKEDQFSSKSKAEIFQNKVKYDQAIAELTESINTAREGLTKILNVKFNQNVSDTDSLQILIKNLDDLIDENSVAEIASLELDDNSSLLSVFRDMHNEIGVNQTKIEELSSQNTEMKKTIKKLTEKSALLESIQKDLNEWISWAKSLHRHITDGQAAPNTSSDLKYVLEESLMTSIGHRKLQRRLEILRAEKKALNSAAVRKFIFNDTFNNNINNYSIDNFNKVNNLNRMVGKFVSVRPIILSLMFARRLQIYGSCLTSAFKFKSEVSESTSDTF